MHPSKAPSMHVTELGISIEVKLVQLTNALSIVFTELGILTLASIVHSINVPISSSTDSGMFISIRLVQPIKVQFMVTTELGILTVIKWLQSVFASCFISTICALNGRKVMI